MNPNDLRNMDKEGNTSNKQITRASGPIRLDEHGNAIGAPVERKTIGSTKVKRKTKELDRSTFIFILVMLSIVGVLAIFIIKFVLPERIVNKPGETTTTTTEPSMYKIEFFKGALLENGKQLSYENTKDKEIQLENGGILKIENKTWTLDLAMRYLDENQEYQDVVFAKDVKYVEPTFAYVGDYAVFIVKYGNNRATEIIGVDPKGKVGLKVYNVNNIPGLVVEDVSFVGTGIYVKASRVHDNIVVTSPVYGQDTGVDICDTEKLKDAKIYDSSYAKASFSIGFRTEKQEFEAPQRLEVETIKEYIKNNNLCKDKKVENTDNTEEQTTN